MNENEFHVVKECIFDNPLFTGIDSLTDSFSKIVKRVFFINLNMIVCMILNLQISLILK